MILPQGTLVVIADGKNLALYRNSGSAIAPRLESEPAPDLEATNFSAGSRDKDKISRFTPGQGKDRSGKLEESAHVIAIVEWLNEQAIDNRLGKVIVIADPRSLGEMRKHYHVKLRDALLGELGKTLTGASEAKVLETLAAL